MTKKFEGFKVTRAKIRPQNPLTLNETIKIIKQFALAKREVKLQLNIFSDEEIEIILVGLPLQSSDFIDFELT